jgi:hypothetical protein
MIEWISTEKELPEKGDTVLVYTDAGSYDIAYLRIGDMREDVCWYADRCLYSTDAIDYWARINAPEPEAENG